jgi:hypothetical protein
MLQMPSFQAEYDAVKCSLPRKNTWSSRPSTWAYIFDLLRSFVFCLLLLKSSVTCFKFYCLESKKNTNLSSGAVADARGGQWGPWPHLDFYKLLYIDLDI